MIDSRNFELACEIAKRDSTYSLDIIISKYKPTTPNTTSFRSEKRVSIQLYKFLHTLLCTVRSLFSHIDKNGSFINSYFILFCQQSNQLNNQSPYIDQWNLNCAALWESYTVILRNGKTPFCNTFCFLKWNQMCIGLSIDDLLLEYFPEFVNVTNVSIPKLRREQ